MLLFGAQGACCNAAQLAMMALGLRFSKAEDFGVLVAVSGGAIVTAFCVQSAAAFADSRNASRGKDD